MNSDSENKKTVLMQEILSALDELPPEGLKQVLAAFILLDGLNPDVLEQFLALAAQAAKKK